MYFQESFSADEELILKRYFTNLTGPVFCLVNLPEVVKGALFSRYSRSNKSLRRLFLDEFVGDLDVSGDITIDATVGLERAHALYEKVFSDYGDDSIAQLGTVHVACEQASNILTKVLERSRLMSYLEQSTRYIPYDKRFKNGHYRYYRDPEILESFLGTKYVGYMDRLFDNYSEALRICSEKLAELFPNNGGVSDFGYKQAIRAKALDITRALLPTATLSNVGILGSGQSYEHLVLRMMTSPLSEVQNYGKMLFEELKKVIPSFLARVERPDRGGVWRQYFQSISSELDTAMKEVNGKEVDEPHAGKYVKLVEYDRDGEEKILAQILFEYGCQSYESAVEIVKGMDLTERKRVIDLYVGKRLNRRHRPSRAFEACNYTFEICSDYGSFRDLQRHRMLTIEWQKLNNLLGFEMPPQVEEFGCKYLFSESEEKSSELYSAIFEFNPAKAPYALLFGNRVRYLMRLNAREAMHIIELRSVKEGHQEYRDIAWEMYRQIENVAKHKLVANSMSFVDFSKPHLERLEAISKREFG